MTEYEFEKACLALGISLSNVQKKQLKCYYEILVEENQKMNLTGITEKDQVYLKHFYDSLTIQKALDFHKIKSLCDVGTGAGFPGVVLKIVFPELKVILVDSLGKRIQFLNKVISSLGLKGISTKLMRAEEYALNHREEVEVVTARAVARLNILAEYCLPIVKQGGYFIPMKASVDEELEASKKAITVLGGTIEEILSFTLLKENSVRTLLKIKKSSVTDRCYPRRYSEMKKHPLGE